MLQPWRGTENWELFCLISLQLKGPADTTVATRLETALALQAVNTEETVAMTTTVSAV